jgi:uncharacterized protein YraI
MRNRFRMAVIAALIGMSSCNLPASQMTETPASTLTSVPDTPTSGTSTSTPVSIETLISLELPTSTATSSVFLASPKDQPVNCRFGPATSYAITGALIVGRQAEIIGRNADSTWWYVRNPSDPSTSCWLSAEFVATVGDVQSLPVVTPLENMVTGVQVLVEPPVLNVACDAWASSAGVVSQDKQILFEAGDTKIAQDYYQVSAINDYVIQAQTTRPNIMTDQASFKVVCTP